MLRPIASEIAGVVAGEVGQIKVAQEKLKEGPASSRQGARKLAAEEKALNAIAMQTIVSENEMAQIQSGADLPAIMRDMTTVLRSDAGKNVFGPKTELLLEKIASAEQAAVEKLAKLDISNLKQTRELILQNQYNARQRRDERDLNFMGGIKAFLDPKAMQPIVQNLKEGMTELGRSDISGIIGGRGALKTATGLKDLLGGEARADDPLFQGLRSQAIEGVMRDMQMKATDAGNFFSTQAKLDPQNRDRFTEMANRLFNEAKDEKKIQIAATKQVDKQLQLDNSVVGNLQSQTKLLDLIHKAITKRGGDLNQITGEARAQAESYTPEEAQRRRDMLTGHISRSRTTMMGMSDTEEKLKEYFSSMYLAASLAGTSSSLQGKLGQENEAYLRDFETLQGTALKLFPDLEARRDVLESKSIQRHTR